MMASITHFFKSTGFERTVGWIYACIGLFAASVVWAENVSDLSQLRVERADDEILVSAQVQFDLPPAVEDALQKGLPLFFVSEAEILRERWYWYDKKIALAERHLRLAYQPLTRRWRLITTSGAAKGANPGLSLTQNFDTLSQALATVKRVSRWKVIDATDLDPTLKYRLEFRFKLDLAQLPLPFQIGTLGQADWDVSVTLQTPLSIDQTK